MCLSPVRVRLQRLHGEASQAGTRSQRDVPHRPAPGCCQHHHPRRHRRPRHRAASTLVHDDPRLHHHQEDETLRRRLLQRHDGSLPPDPQTTSTVSQVIILTCQPHPRLGLRPHTQYRPFDTVSVNKVGFTKRAGTFPSNYAHEACWVLPL